MQADRFGKNREGKPIRCRSDMSDTGILHAWVMTEYDFIRECPIHIWALQTILMHMY